MTLPTIIAVDPGGRHAGVIARRGPALLYAATVERATLDRLRFVDELLETVDRAITEIRGEGLGLDALAVEDVNPPTGHAPDRPGHLIDLEPIITTAVLLGSLLGAYAGVTVVPPGGHGSGPLEAYPAELVGPTERHGRYGKRRHVRSAWDVAGAAALILRARALSPA